MKKHFLLLFLISNLFSSPSLLPKTVFGNIYCSLAAGGATWGVYTGYKKNILNGESPSTRLATNASMGAILGTSLPVFFPLLMVGTGIEKFKQITEKKS